MDPEVKRLLDKISHLAEDNNRMLRKMRKAAVIGTVFHIIYWFVIIGLSVGVFYFVQPYLETVTGIVDGAGDQINFLKTLVK